ncbi:MAG TPA: thymidine phosphorylase [Candidatus Paceibacterota bacterium]|nr:thymidine phosphorylase [Candidatus Paceibacterota bacterium]
MAERRFDLKVVPLDIATGRNWIVLVNEADGLHYGIRAGDEISLKWDSHQTEVAVDLTKSFVQEGEIGIFRDILEKYQIKAGEILSLAPAPKPESLAAIGKKLNGGRLSEKEIVSIVKDTINYKLSDLELAYFVASSFPENNFTKEEAYFQTKAFAETGEMFKFGKIVADKHSIGGLPGNKITPIIVSIVASYGIIIPKTSSRAITSEAGTADALSVIAPVSFDREEIENIVKKTNACLIWGGALKIAPADDRFITVLKHLGTEPLSKMVVSIMAKKVAMGVTHLVIDFPMGEGTKIKNKIVAKKTIALFQYIAKKFGIKLRVIIQEAKGPVGRGIGPALGIRDDIAVLNQLSQRPLDLEAKATKLAGVLLELIGYAGKGQGSKLAYKALQNKQALAKFKEIINAQGGTVPDYDEIALAPVAFAYKADHDGEIKQMDNVAIIELARILGAPETLAAGVYLNKSLGDQYKTGETLYTLYTESEVRLEMARDFLANHLLIK